MKKIIILSVFALLALDAGAQGIQRQRAELARPDSFTRARVEVTEEPDAARAIIAADRVTRKDKITGYRVNIFYDNKQMAGENARSVMAKFRQLYPDIPVRLSYKSPVFEVAAGNFADKVDAIALWGRLLSSFPNAIVSQEEIFVSDIMSAAATAGTVKENYSGSVGD